MKVLYVTGACLFNNTSANMSHNAYVQGLLENGADLDIIMASDSWGESDSKFKKYPDARYFIYNSVSVIDRIRLKGRGIIRSQVEISLKVANVSGKEAVSQRPSVSLKSKVRSCLKRLFYACFKQDPIYPLQKTWLKKAIKFKSENEYDLVVSNSSPAASHRLVSDLLERKRIKARRWVQIWEDPWYYDLYGLKSEAILEEEHYLLRRAQEILYVSPLTIHYQKRYFPDCAEKMKVIPLPAFNFGCRVPVDIKGPVAFGYFGDYNFHVRNLKPFYEALNMSGMPGYIYGDSDMPLPSSDTIVVSGRVTLDVLEGVQDKTSVLVHLSNLKGGQIPGKIYHYSATSKPILFILDGSDDEKLLLRNYFSKFDRYVFCENNSEEILNAMKAIVKRFQWQKPVDDFSPKAVVKMFV